MAKNEKKRDYQITYLFKDNLYKKAESHIKKNSLSYLNYINKYMDKNSEIIFAKAPYKQLVYAGDDIKIVFKTLNLSIKEIDDCFKQTETGQLLSNSRENGRIYRADYIGMVMIMKYYHDQKKEKEFTTALMYLTLAIYTTIFYRYTRGYNFNENIMDYTINNLSNKYDIKKLGSLFKALYKLATVCATTYRDYFDDFNDRQIAMFIMNMRTRINNFLKEIKDAYEKNKASGNYLNYDQENKTKEGFYETDNASFLIDRLSTKVVNYVLTNGVDVKLSDFSAQLCDVSRAAIRDALEKIIKTENQEIKEVVSILLQQYLVVEGKPAEGIGSKNFITIALKIYAKSNTNDKNVIRLKEILDKWLKMNCERYQKTERAATQNNLRKAAFLYFVLCTQKVYIN